MVLRINKASLKHIWLYYARWPLPVWRLTAGARLRLAGRDFRFCLENNHSVQWATRVLHGSWEPTVIDFVQKALRPGDVFFDVGAWIGPYTLIASSLVSPGGRVYSFEPDPVSYARLEKNLTSNGASNVSVFPYAVADKRGYMKLESDYSGSPKGIVVQGDEGVEVETIGLTDFCIENDIFPTVLKIDVEGAESMVLDGGFEVFRRARVIVLEYHEAQIRKVGRSPEEFLRALTRVGKKVILLYQKKGTGPERGATLTEDDVIIGNAHLALV